LDFVVASIDEADALQIQNRSGNAWKETLLLWHTKIALVTADYLLQSVLPILCTFNAYLGRFLESYLNFVWITVG
jgi:hypothetical protein